MGGMVMHGRGLLGRAMGCWGFMDHDHTYSSDNLTE